MPDQPATNAINHLFAGVPVCIEHEGIENYSNGVRGRHAVRCVCGAGVESREHLNGSGVTDEMTRIALIGQPYDSALRDFRMGAGARILLEAARG